MSKQPEDPRDVAEWLGEAAEPEPACPFCELLQPDRDAAATIAALNARVLAAEAETARLKAALAKVEPLTRCGCGDQFTEHDRGTCGNCMAAADQTSEVERLRKDAERLQAMLRDMVWAMSADPSCQKGVVASCVCRACVLDRVAPIDAAMACGHSVAGG